MLRANDCDNLAIRQFIFHPILKDVDDEIYFDEVALTPVQRGFFKQWLAKSIRQATEFEFVNKVAPDSLWSKADALRTQGAVEFTAASKEITSLFKRFHKGSSSDGILVLALTRTPSGDFLFLVKTTFENVLSYKDKLVNGIRKVTLAEIPHPISEDTTAIQKAALINVNANGYDWQVLAQDRQNAIPYKIADFFQKFLNVREKEVASVLTRKVFTAVKRWANSNRGALDPQQHLSDYWGRAYDYLHTHDEFETDSFVSSVVVDGNEERRTELRTSLTDALVHDELAGRVFPPRPDSIPKREAKTTIKTQTGVTINFTGTQEANNIAIRREGDEQVITIRTTEIEFA
jgi:hypothetical protein